MSESCEWVKDLDDRDVIFWESKCGAAHVFSEGGPIENEHKFCPYCGKTLVIKEG